MAGGGRGAPGARFRVDESAAGSGLCGGHRAERELAAGSRSHHRLLAYRLAAPELDNQFGNRLRSDAREHGSYLRVREKVLWLSGCSASICTRRLMYRAGNRIRDALLWADRADLFWLTPGPDGNHRSADRR